MEISFNKFPKPLLFFDQTSLENLLYNSPLSEPNDDVKKMAEELKNGLAVNNSTPLDDGEENQLSEREIAIQTIATQLMQQYSFANSDRIADPTRSRDIAIQEVTAELWERLNSGISDSNAYERLGQLCKELADEISKQDNVFTKIPQDFFLTRIWKDVPDYKDYVVYWSSIKQALLIHKKLIVWEKKSCRENFDVFKINFFDHSQPKIQKWQGVHEIFVSIIPGEEKQSNLLLKESHALRQAYSLLKGSHELFHCAGFTRDKIERHESINRSKPHEMSIIFEPKLGTLASLYEGEYQNLEGAALQIFIDSLLDRVNVIHKHNLLHFNLTAENLIIKQDGTLTIAGFKSSLLASNNKELGSLPSPKILSCCPFEVLSQIRTKRSFTPSQKIDCWMVGLLFLEIAFGQKTSWQKKLSAMTEEETMEETIQAASLEIIRFMKEKENTLALIKKMEAEKEISPLKKLLATIAVNSLLVSVRQRKNLMDVKVRWSAGKEQLRLLT